jgi:outer membrane protein assembly factor BamB
MAEREQEVFLPEEVDEQIDEYLTPSTTNKQSLDMSAQETVRALQRHFAPPEQDTGLQRVWQRFEQQRTAIRSHVRADLLAIGQQERRYRMKQVVGSSHKESNSRWTRRLNLIAAVIFVTLLVGSMIALFHLAPHGQAGVSGQPKEKMMFVLANDTFYRLDMKTHQVLWHFNVSGGMGFGQVVNDTYYIPLTNGSLTKLCAVGVANGKVRWQVDLPGRQLVNPVIANNRLYFSAIKGGYWTVIALDSASGAQKWEYRIGDKVVMDHGMFAAEPSVFLIAASDQAVYGEMMTTRDSKESGLRFALRAQDGKPLWQKDEETAYTIGIDKGFVGDGVLVVAKDSDDMNVQGLGEQGYVAGYDVASGKLLWSKQLDGPLFGPTSLFGPMDYTKVVNGVIYVSTNRTIRGQGNSIYAFSVRDGAQLWHYQDTDTSGGSYPTVTENGVYFNRYAGQTLVALDSTTGKIRWTYNFHDPLTVEYPPSADNDQVYLSLPNNVIQILRASDGKPISSFKVGGKVDPNNRVLLQVIG